MLFFHIRVEKCKDSPRGFFLDTDTKRFKLLFLPRLNSSQKPLRVRRGSAFAIFLSKQLKKELRKIMQTIALSLNRTKKIIGH